MATQCSFLSFVIWFLRNDQIEAISTKLPVDKADLKKFFPK